MTTLKPKPNKSTVHFQFNIFNTKEKYIYPFFFYVQKKAAYTFLLPFALEFEHCQCHVLKL